MGLTAESGPQQRGLRSQSDGNRLEAVSQGTDRLSPRLKLKEPAISKRSGQSQPRSDAALVRQVQAGQTEAFGKLVERYQDRVFNTCWRICGSLEDARDLTQDAFLKALANISDFRRKSGFYTWLYRIAVNMALSHRRKMKHRATVSLDRVADPTGSQAERLADRIEEPKSRDPAAEVQEAELRGRAVRALQALDEDQRAVVVLRDIEGLDYRQIAGILDIAPGTVKSRLHRARLALREALVGSDRGREG